MSTSDAQPRATKKREYRLGKRAQKLEDTRRRIVEATVDLHGTVGPALTTVSLIAERAGVQRHTVYAHFPDEGSLFEACSGLSLERDPLPDAESWMAHSAGRDRVRIGLGQLYAWFDRNHDLTACVLRDAQYHQPTRDIVELRMQPFFDRASAVLSSGLSDRSKQIIPVALEFACWRALSPSNGPAEAATLMADAILGLDRKD